MFLFRKKLDELVGPKDEFSFKATYSEEERIAKRKNIDEKYTGNRQRGIAYIVLERSPNSKIKEFKKPFKLYVSG